MSSTGVTVGTCDVDEHCTGWNDSQSASVKLGLSMIELIVSTYVKVMTVLDIELPLTICL